MVEILKEIRGKIENQKVKITTSDSKKVRWDRAMHNLGITHAILILDEYISKLELQSEISELIEDTIAEWAKGDK